MRRTKYSWPTSIPFCVHGDEIARRERTADEAVLSTRDPQGLVGHIEGRTWRAHGGKHVGRNPEFSGWCRTALRERRAGHGGQQGSGREDPRPEAGHGLSPISY
jgi:hypothetical protein